MNNLKQFSAYLFTNETKMLHGQQHWNNEHNVWMPKDTTAFVCHKCRGLKINKGRACRTCSSTGMISDVAAQRVIQKQVKANKKKIKEQDKFYNKINEFVGSLTNEERLIFDDVLHQFKHGLTYPKTML